MCIVYISIELIKKMYINLYDKNNENFTTKEIIENKIKKKKNSNSNKNKKNNNGNKNKQTSNSNKDKKKELDKDHKKNKKAILSECLSGCPFDRKTDSPCKNKKCFQNPNGNECKSIIKKFCKKKDISDRNKLGCKIYDAVQNTEPEFVSPWMEPISEPPEDYEDLAMLIPQFVEIDLLEKIVSMKALKKAIIKRDEERSKTEGEEEKEKRIEKENKEMGIKNRNVKKKKKDNESKKK